MKTALKNMAIFALALTVGMAPFMCCCFTGTAQAHETPSGWHPTPQHHTGAQGCCHAASGRDSPSKDNGGCNCAKAFGVVTAGGLDMLTASRSGFSGNGAAFVFLAEKDRSFSKRPQGPALVDPAPPSNTSIPLSPRNSVLRL